ncbi:tyrosine-type recombinase/integrase [Kordiimonas sp.]|uniref:tyrosine-type recombinase/integrase n=1 Tax=Kordiimonas sp. TaxID=1970157 RepID=UPI003A956026
MASPTPPFRRLSLFTDTGDRKYLNRSERARFHSALSALNDPIDRSFCEMLYWTGCRPSEALGLTAQHIDLDENMVIIRSLKKRGSQKGRHYRPIPLPQDYVERLDTLHGIRQQQLEPAERTPLWPFRRTTAWRRIKTVMEAAGINGTKASGRGLRHAYGVHAALSDVPETRIKKWLGHESLDTTAIYLDMAASEDRMLAARMWEATP